MGGKRLSRGTRECVNTHLVSDTMIKYAHARTRKKRRAHPPLAGSVPRVTGISYENAFSLGIERIQQCAGRGICCNRAMLPRNPLWPLYSRKGDMNDLPHSIGLWAFFAFLGAFLFFLGYCGQPLVHPYFDQIGIRDAGTLFHYYASCAEPVKTLIGRAMLHIEGPLQFLLINAYCYSVGELLPLNPSIMQIPNVVFALLSAVMAYLLGTRLLSPRLGYCCALTFAFGPWLGETLRQPWYFNTLSCLLHFSVFYSFLRLSEIPESRLFRICAAGGLAAYVFTGMDWPSFLFSLGVFLVLCGRLRAILKNPYNVLVLAAVAIQVAWPVALFLTGRGAYLNGTILLYPFLRYGDLASNPDFWSRIWVNVISAWGPQLIFAVIGLVVYVTRMRKECVADRTHRALLDSMCVWFVGAGYALFKSSTSATYLYVAAMPAALLGGLALSRLRNRYVVCAALIMAGCQLWLTIGQQFQDEHNGRRVLAAAAFLIEQRPDLLAEQKVAFLPRNVASDVGQYARGKNRRVIMPQEFPIELQKHAIGSDEKTLRKFVDTYNARGHILADWLILDTELFSEELRAAGFYARLRDDPAIRWIARFKDTGGELFVGEVLHGQGSPATDAPLMDTPRLSDTYEAKYDRIGFLKHNVQYVDHY